MKNSKGQISISGPDGVLIPPQCCQLTAAAFNGIFDAGLASGEEGTYPETYERVERAHVLIFGARRYASYDSFRRARGRLLGRNGTLSR